MTDHREIRVFLSSTFKDMQAERDYLIKHVFPEVRGRCADRGVGFTEIDLRWGITEEEAKSGTTIAICLSEIDRCRGYPPFFIGFLGERYGWIPDQTELESYLQRSDLEEYQDTIKDAMHKGISVTELEFNHAIEGQQIGRAEAAFYLRCPELTKMLAEQAGAENRQLFYDHSDDKLNNLKARLRQNPLLVIDNYITVEEFGASIKTHLLNELERIAPEAESPISRFRRPHQNFARNRISHYVPLDTLIHSAEKYVHSRLSGREERLYLVQGESGLGKSSLMAYLASHFRASIADAEVIDCYIGANGEYSIQQWVDELITFLADRLPDNDKSSSQPLSENRWESLANILAEYAHHLGSKPLILLLDAVNQLGDAPQAIEHLQNINLPAGVVLILSSTPELRINPHRVLVDKMSKPTREQAGAIIDLYRKTYRKELSSELLEHLLNSAVTLPLHLRLIMEFLRVRGSHESLEQDLLKLLEAPSPKELFLTTLRGWDKDYADEQHPELVCRAAGYLAASRAGLSEDELGTLLAAESDPVDPHSGKPRLPREKLSQLLAVLRPYLVRNYDRDTFMHRVLREAALEANPIEEQRLKILAALNADNSWCVTEQLYQHMHLATDPSVATSSLGELQKLLSQPSNILHCHQLDPGLLSQALQKTRTSKPANSDPVTQNWASHSALTNSTSAYVAVGEWLRIENFFLEAKAWCLMTLAMRALPSPGTESPRSLLTIMLAATHLALGESYNAKEKLEEVLNVLSDEDDSIPLRVSALNNLGACNAAMSDFTAGQANYQKALLLLRSEIAAGHEKTDIHLVAPLNNLADLYRRQYEQAQQQVWIREAQKASPHDIQKAKTRLEDIAPQLDLAAGHYQEAIDIEKSFFPSGSPFSATIQNNLATVLRMQGKLDAALLLLQEAQEIEQRLLRENHPDRARTKVNFGLVYQDQKQLNKAAASFTDAIAIYRADNAASILESGMTTALGELATIRAEQKAPKHELAQLWQELGDAHLDLRALNPFAAEQALMKALGLRRELNDPDNSKVARTLYSIGMALFYQQKLTTADGEYGAETVISAAMGEFPENHPDQPEFVIKCQTTLVDILLRIVEKHKADGDNNSAHDAAQQAKRYIKAIEDAKALTT